MSEAFKIEDASTLTDRYQTTVPETVRRALNLRKRDRIYYTIRPNGEVLISGRSPVPMDDPALGQFLEFLQNDIANHPEHLQAVDATLFERINSLIGKCSDIDLNSVLPEEDNDH